MRLAIGGIGPVPDRLTEVEQFLLRGPLTAERLEQAADMPVVAGAPRAPARNIAATWCAASCCAACSMPRGAPAPIPALLTPELEAAYA